MDDKLMNSLDELDIIEASTLLEDINIDKLNNKMNKRITSNVKYKLNISKTSSLSIFPFFNINYKKVLIYNLGLVSTLLICLLTSSYYNNRVVSYVSLDINPSIELALNNKDLVINYSPLNEDGKKILDENPPTNVPIDSALEFLISKSIDNGYLTSTNIKEITLSTTNKDSNKTLELETELINKTNTILMDKGLKIDVNGCTSTLDFRDEAKSYGLSPGKLKIIMQIQERDNNISIESLKDFNMFELRKLYNSYTNNIDKNINNTPNNEVEITEPEANDMSNSSGNNTNSSSGNNYTDNPKTNNNNNNNNNNEHENGNSSGNGNGNGPNNNHGNKGNQNDNKPNSNGNGSGNGNKNNN